MKQLNEQIQTKQNEIEKLNKEKIELKKELNTYKIKYIMINTDDEQKLLNFLSKSFPEVQRVILK